MSGHGLRLVSLKMRITVVRFALSLQPKGELNVPIRPPHESRNENFSHRHPWQMGEHSSL